ncbi:MAG TPA: pyridoxal-phosphate dependent enzyme [Candidatus Saccharimonadales bacterium]|nr:pyridoxal-phosphate dependent enzyme [Candidatus Saccharimonadales bacterium]
MKADHTRRSDPVGERHRGEPAGPEAERADGSGGEPAAERAAGPGAGPAAERANWPAGFDPLALACPSCSTTVEDLLAWRCPDCEGPLELPAGSIAPGRGPLGGQGVWRYRWWLPPVEPVSLGEPTTPLVTLRWPGGPATFKLEPSQPTGSFKDRASALLAGWLRARGATRVAEDSSGNAGASLAAYCARARIDCDIYAPASASPAKLTQIAAYGARVIRVEGSRQAATDAAARSAGRGVVYATHLWNPLCLAGTATFAFELWEQTDGTPPDVIVFPLGAGTLLLGALRAFEAMCVVGMMSRVPRVFGVQSAACAPLAEASAAGSDEPATVTPATSAAEGIMLARPPRGAEILRRTRESGGGVVAVDDDALWAALRRLAGLGVYVEPTSAVAPAGLDLLRATGRIGAEERVLVALTGSGLKAGDRIRAGLGLD